MLLLVVVIYLAHLLLMYLQVLVGNSLKTCKSVPVSESVIKKHMDSSTLLTMVETKEIQGVNDENERMHIRNKMTIRSMRA
jgi:hypothetical protein